MCLPSDALLQHLPSYLGFSYLERGVSLHGCSSKAQPLLLTLDEGYLLTTTLPDLQRGIAPLGPPAPAQPWLLGHGPPRRTLGWSSWTPPLASGVGLLFSAAAAGTVKFPLPFMERYINLLFHHWYVNMLINPRQNHCCGYGLKKFFFVWPKSHRGTQKL